MPRPRQFTRIPYVPKNTPMFDGPAMSKLGGLTRTWIMFFESLLVGQIFGDPIASAAIISPLFEVHHITGTAAINTIEVPDWLRPGDALSFIPDGAFSWTNAGNISVAGTAVVGRVLTFTNDGSAPASLLGGGKLYPSYV